jgi:hypothetical protein
MGIRNEIQCRLGVSRAAAQYVIDKMTTEEKDKFMEVVEEEAENIILQLAFMLSGIICKDSSYAGEIAKAGTDKLNLQKEL